MATELFEDNLDLTIDFLEAEPIAAGPAYPFPRLHLTGRRGNRTFRTVVLENPYLRLTLVPALGGRILSLYDKRTNTETLFSRTELNAELGERRGVCLPAGLVLRLDGKARLNDLGNVATLFDEATDEETPGGVWVAETSLANGLAFHLKVSLPPDRAEVVFEARVHNRTFAPLPYNGELALYVGEGELQDRAFYSQSRDAGFVFESEDAFDGVRLEDGVFRIARFPMNQPLAPRQVDAWTVRLTPITRVGALLAASTEVNAGLKESVLRLQTVQPRPGAQVFLLTEDEQTLKAQIDLYPEHIFETKLDVPVQAITVSTAGKETLLAPSAPRPSTFTPSSNAAQLSSDLRNATFDLGARHMAYTLRAIDALAQKEFAQADARFEQALMYNADDPLLWWGKALAQRNLGTEGEPAELLNAHYLAPLEPALRAEAFLAQSPEMGREASPLLKGLNENPEDFIEVACMLIEHGQLDQASRWIDEALRHRELAMLHLLMADILLRGTRMAAEAAQHVASAARHAGPPYPWRPVEREALARLAERFPQDEHIASLLNLTKER